MPYRTGASVVICIRVIRLNQRHCIVRDGLLVLADLVVRERAIVKRLSNVITAVPRHIGVTSTQPTQTCLEMFGSAAAPTSNLESPIRSGPPCDRRSLGCGKNRRCSDQVQLPARRIQKHYIIKCRRAQWNISNRRTFVKFKQRLHNRISGHS